MAFVPYSATLFLTNIQINIFKKLNKLVEESIDNLDDIEMLKGKVYLLDKLVHLINEIEYIRKEYFYYYVDSGSDSISLYDAITKDDYIDPRIKELADLLGYDEEDLRGLNEDDIWERTGH